MWSAPSPSSPLAALTRPSEDSSRALRVWGIRWTRPFSSQVRSVASPVRTSVTMFLSLRACRGLGVGVARFHGGGPGVAAGPDDTALEGGHEARVVFDRWFVAGPRARGGG